MSCDSLAGQMYDFLEGEAEKYRTTPKSSWIDQACEIEKFMKDLREHESAEKARQEKWDRRYLALAKFVAGWSRDPSTQTGAVIVDSDRRVVSLGYNGFAKGVDDSAERYANRELKYKMVCHCEINAILFAERDRLKGSTLYTHPFMSCSRCAVQVIQAGVARCVAPPLPAHLQERWAEDIELSKLMFREAGVQLDIVEVALVD